MLHDLDKSSPRLQVCSIVPLATNNESRDKQADDDGRLDKSLAERSWLALRGGSARFSKSVNKLENRPGDSTAKRTRL